MYKAVIDCSRRVASAQARLEAFIPEPPFGAEALHALHVRELEAERSRADLAIAERERTEHLRTHLLTMS